MVVVVVVVLLLLPVVLMVPLTAYKPAAATILRSRELCTRTKRSRTRHGRLDETSACVSANFRISSRIMLITRHGVATTSVLPRARCFDDRRRAASSVISSRRECKRERERGEGEREKTEREWMAHGPLAETRQHGLPAPEEIDLSAIPQLAGPHSFLTKHVRFMGQIETDENTYDRSGAVYRYVGIWKFDLT